MVGDIVPAVDDLAAWIDHFRSIAKSETAIELLEGVQAATLEVVTYAFLGLGRAAITAIRLQIDMVLSYTYFKDHPVEWETVKGTGDGYMLIRDINKYHGEIDSNFNTRIGYLNNKPGRSLHDIYHILSAHIHRQSPYTLPALGPLESIVLDLEMMNSIIELQRQSTTESIRAYKIESRTSVG